MEQFLDEVRAYAQALGLSPSTVIQRANCGGGTTWARWESGVGSPTMKSVDRVRRWMKENPPAARKKEGASGTVEGAA